jgi:hypothetical protein
VVFKGAGFDVFVFQQFSSDSVPPGQLRATTAENSPAHPAAAAHFSPFLLKHSNLRAAHQAPCGNLTAIPREIKTDENTNQVETRISSDAPSRLPCNSPKRIVFRAYSHHLDPEFPEFQSCAGSAACLVRDGIQNAKLSVTPARAPFGDTGTAGVKAWGERYGVGSRKYRSMQEN